MTSVVENGATLTVGTDFEVNSQAAPCIGWQHGQSATVDATAHRSDLRDANPGMTLSRNSGTGSSITTNTYNFLGVQMAYSPAPQNADIKQGDSRSNTTNDEFSAAGVTPRARDQITVDGRTLAVQGVRAVFDWPSCIGFDCWYRG